MICQCLFLLVIIYVGDVHSLPQWIGGQIYTNSPIAYEIQNNNQWTSRDISEVPIKTDVAKPASRMEGKKSRVNSAYLPPQNFPNGTFIKPRQDSESDGYYYTNPTNDEMQPTWQDQIASSFSSFWGNLCGNSRLDGSAISSTPYRTILPPVINNIQNDQKESEKPIDNELTSQANTDRNPAKPFYYVIPPYHEYYYIIPTSIISERRNIGINSIVSKNVNVQRSNAKS